MVFCTFSVLLVLLWGETVRAKGALNSLPSQMRKTLAAIYNKNHNPKQGDEIFKKSMFVLFRISSQY